MAKKLVASNFVFQAFERLIEKFNSREGFFRKSPFLYFLLHKSWIWRTLGHVMDIFSYCHFQKAWKKCFWPKKIKFHAPVQKCHFGNFSIFPKWHFWTGAWNLIFFYQKYSFEALWKCHWGKIFITCPRVRQIQDLCRKKY